MKSALARVPQGAMRVSQVSGPSLFQRAVVVDPAGCGALLAMAQGPPWPSGCMRPWAPRKTLFRGCKAYGPLVRVPTHRRLCYRGRRKAHYRRGWAGPSPGRGSHPLDDTQGFMIYSSIPLDRPAWPHHATTPEDDVVEDGRGVSRGAAAEHAPGPQTGTHLDGRTHPCGSALGADERAELVSLQLNDFEVAQHPLVDALRRCRDPLEPSRDGMAGMARDPGGRRNAHTLDAQARDLVAFHTRAAKAAVRCPSVRADRSPADRRWCADAGRPPRFKPSSPSPTDAVRDGLPSSVIRFRT